MRAWKPLFALALKSLRSRREAAFLTFALIALSVALLLSVERVQRAAREGFTQAISQVDLIVGARSGPVNLLLYSVFNIGQATNNVSWESYQHFKSHPAVSWTIPFSLGDSHRGFRVIGTTAELFSHYRFRGDSQLQFLKGSAFSELWDVVIGSEVAKKLGYDLGSKIVVAHGVTRGQGVVFHDDKPFTVVGVLRPSGTPMDQAVLMSLEGIAAIHVDWMSGAMPTRETAIPAEQITPEQLKTTSITGFFLRTSSRVESLRLQREINEYGDEALLAILPGVVLAELWRSLGYLETSFRVVGWMVVVIGLLSMMVALLAGLEARRREMSVLRSLGARPGQVTGLLLGESFALCCAGILGGYLLHFAGFVVLAGWLSREFGLVLTGLTPSLGEIATLLVLLVFGTLIGLVPALRARSNSLKDGLRQKV